MKKFVGLMVFGVVFLMGTARSDDRAGSKEPASDKEFVLRGIAIDLAEIRMGERALKLASSDEVKSFARKMVNEHGKHRKELMSLAKNMRWDVETGMLKEHQDELDKLNKLSGKEFDIAYAKTMVMGHEKALKMYEKWAKDAENDKVRDMAKKTAEVVREHLDMARKLTGERSERNR